MLKQKRALNLLTEVFSESGNFALSVYKQVGFCEWSNPIFTTSSNLQFASRNANETVRTDLVDFFCYKLIYFYEYLASQSCPGGSFLLLSSRLSHLCEGGGKTAISEAVVGQCSDGTMRPDCLTSLVSYNIPSSIIICPFKTKKNPHKCQHFSFLAVD